MSFYLANILLNIYILYNICILDNFYRLLLKLIKIILKSLCPNLSLTKFMALKLRKRKLCRMINFSTIVKWWKLNKNILKIHLYIPNFINLSSKKQPPIHSKIKIYTNLTFLQYLIKPTLQFKNLTDTHLKSPKESKRFLLKKPFKTILLKSISRNVTIWYRVEN